MKDFYATIIIDLNNKSEEEVLKNVDRSRRKNVNKANSLGILKKLMKKNGKNIIKFIAEFGRMGESILSLWIN